MSADAAIRPYDLMHQLAPSDDAIPDGETLDEISLALGGVQEFFTERVMRGVIHVADAGEPYSVTFEDIGRLITWADHMRDQADQIIDDVEKVLIVARESWSIAGGSRGDGTIYDKNGHPLRDDDGPGPYHDFVRQTRGFARRGSTDA
jgi:hypothetical protein